jgi:hypothetical protein
MLPGERYIYIDRVSEHVQNENDKIQAEQAAAGKW